MKLLSIFAILFIGSASCQSEDPIAPLEQSETPESNAPKSDEIQSFTEPDNDVNIYDPKKCTLTPSPTLQEINDFYEWSDKHNKVYKTPQAKICKLVRVVYHMREIKAHNELFEQGKVSYQRDLTQYSDLSHDEKLETLLMKEVEFKPHLRQLKTPLPILPPARASVDWRVEGLVTPVGTQWKCGCCYAWAGSAALEGQLLKCGIYYDQVSVQQMVDCPTVGVWGCKSGWAYHAFKWQMNGGILAANTYTYKDAPGNCTYNKNDIVGYVHKAFQFNFTSVGGNASFIKQVVSAIGPVATVICVDSSLYQYKSGVYTISNCCQEVKHVVAIVGYGTDPKFGDYWIIKNSWGENWGEKGYAKIARGKNLCISESIIDYAQVRDVDGTVCDLF
ncbi:crustapain-like [Chironomus tepperi]|uniref:crustapain-like n=1 Tax=Chironomus tepperi TaxID=113505 RepID=UPI00391F788F